MSSAKILAAKQSAVAELTEQLKASQAGVLVNYYKTSVEDDTNLRKELTKAGVTYKVVKNTQLKFVFENLGYTDLNSHLEGMTAIAYSETDPVAPAKILSKFAKEHEDYTIKAGYVDGGVIDAAGVENLASIPSKEGLIAKLLGSIQSPLYGLAYVLQGKIDKEGGAAEEAPAAE
ncbi:MAG: 50S ribosomal protein L10 [Ruminococcaceae bacterium]|nr:50S ribosomal protein L10 [Oscillospiraceae bacterium]